MIETGLVFICNEIQKGIDVGEVVEGSLVIFVVDETEEEFPLLRALGVDREDRLWKQNIDSIFNENPSYLRSFQHVEIISLVLKLKISLHDKAQKDVEEANVIDKECYCKVKLPD